MLRSRLLSTIKRHSRLMSTSIEEQGSLVRKLKSDPIFGPNHDDTKAAIAKLVELKKASAPESASKQKFQLKVPKGTKDWSDQDMNLREQIFNTITRVFKSHGGVTIDTPVFELREILAGKYGEDSKLIYDLKDQGGEICSLRYDLTVPFARWLAMNSNVEKIKRYHIAKVYRRDQPAMTKGRMREFYQCDFDIAGVYDTMIADAEILRILCEVLDKLEIKDYTIKLNHRKILDGIFEICGVPEDKIRTISSAVDKLDKLPWESVRSEMIDEKGCDPEVADKIGEYVVHSGDETLLEKLSLDTKFSANARAKAGITDMTILFKYLKAFKIAHRIKFDLSLARGLDYYTGIIYEAVTAASAPKTIPNSVPDVQAAKGHQDADRSDDDSVGVGSIAAGGRYDNLVGMFTGKKTGIPCVGISVGVERVFSLLRSRVEHLRSNEVDVYVMAFGKSGLLEERMDVCTQLWEAGINAEFLYKRKPNSRQQFEAAEKGGVPLAVILGEQELQNGTIKLKTLGTREQNEGEDVRRTDMVDHIQKLLQALALR